MSAGHVDAGPGRSARAWMSIAGWMVLLALSWWLLARVHGPGARAQAAPEIWAALAAWVALLWWALDRLSGRAGGKLRGLLASARSAFLDTLAGRTLADITARPSLPLA